MDINLVFSRFCKSICNCDHILTEDSIRYYWFSAMLIEDSCTNNYICELPYAQMIRFKDSNGNLPIWISKKNFESLKPQGHNNLRTQELDLLYWNKENNECLSFEMKFHRDSSSSSSFAEPDSAGRLFNDIRRLSIINSDDNVTHKRLFLYITDYRMDMYLDKPGKVFKDSEYRKFLKEFYGLAHHEELEIKVNERFIKPATFFKSASHSFTSFENNIVPINTKVRMHCRENLNSSSPSFRNKNGGTSYNCHIRLYEILTTEGVENPE